MAEGLSWLSPVADSVAAVGTVGALLVAAVAYRRQVADRHREQASKVWGYVSRSTGTAYVGNGSDEPVYDAVIRFVSTSGLWLADSTGGADLVLAPTTPDRPYTITPASEIVVERADQRLELTFTDANDVRWVRTASGRLKEVR
jgi:hypothetical protein